MITAVNEEMFDEIRKSTLKQLPSSLSKVNIDEVS